MKKKILALATIFMILFTNYAFAYTKDESDELLKDSAKIVNKEEAIEVLSESYLHSLSVLPSNIYLYKYGTIQEFTDYTWGYRNSTDVSEQEEGKDTQSLYYEIDIPKGTTNKEICTVEYRESIETKEEGSPIFNYEGLIKLNIKLKNADLDKDVKLRILKGRRLKPETSPEEGATTESNYTLSIFPQIGVIPEKLESGEEDIQNVHSELEIEYKIGTMLPQERSGIFVLEDIDRSQGYALNDFEPSEDNTYLLVQDNVDFAQNEGVSPIDTIKYNNNDNETYIYSTTAANIKTLCDVYTEVTPKKTLEVPNNGNMPYCEHTLKFTLTFDHKTTGAYSSLLFGYADSLAKRLNQYTVTFHSERGTPVPEQQIVPGEGKATEPTTEQNPKSEGYEFIGWTTNNEPTVNSTKYDFNQAITDNVDLYAIWKPIEYPIEYILDGGTNDSSNPSTYTTDKGVETFKNPTKTGYTFKGWYEDSQFTTPKDNIRIGSTGKVTLYAKWEENTPEPNTANYTVKHYKEDKEGTVEVDNKKYKLDEPIDYLTDEIGKTVSAEPKNYEGYKVTKTSETKDSGEVEADGSLILKLYYDLEDYKVTFDPDGGTPDPDDQTVKYKEKVEKPDNPNKEDYTFDGWYYKDGKKEGEIYNFDDPVTENVNLIAKWKEKKQISVNPKEDPTTMPEKVLPNAGELAKKVKGIFIVVSLLIIIILGVRYYRFKNLFK